jgi:hypothetical protein
MLESLLQIVIIDVRKNERNRPKTGRVRTFKVFGDVAAVIHQLQIEINAGLDTHMLKLASPSRRVRHSPLLVVLGSAVGSAECALLRATRTQATIADW